MQQKALNHTQFQKRFGTEKAVKETVPLALA